MIYGALGDIEEYRGMLKGLDVLIDWLEENDPAELEVGSHPTRRSLAILPTTSVRCLLPASPTCPRSSSRAMARSRSRRSALSCLQTLTGRSSALLG